jgi:hypothetical protein
MTANEQQQRLQVLLQPLPISATLFPPNSRYAGIGTAVLDPAGDRPIIYLRRRFVPQPERLATLREHVVLDGERPDHIAATELGDPELFWRLCDANRAVFPAELVEEVGRRLRVPLPEGMPGNSDE